MKISIVSSLIICFLLITAIPPIAALEGEYILYGVDYELWDHQIVGVEFPAVIDESGTMFWYEKGILYSVELTDFGNGMFTWDFGQGSYTTDNEFFISACPYESANGPGEPWDQHVILLMGIRRGENLPLSTFNGYYFFDTFDSFYTGRNSPTEIITQRLGVETVGEETVNVTTIAHSNGQDFEGEVGYSADSEGRIQLDVGNPVTVFSAGEFFAGAGNTKHISNPAFGIGVRRSVGLSNLDLSGTYRVFEFQSANYDADKIALISRMTFDGNGSGTVSLEEQITGRNGDPETFTYSLSDDGQFSLSNGFMGVLNSKREVISIIDVNSQDGTLSLGIGIKIPGS